MLDVHPVHHAAQSWRDFIIHIATITVGLLIAIGLEQTVEYFHHLHQVEEMETSVRAENAEMQEVAAFNNRVIDDAVGKANVAIADIQASSPGQERVKAPAEIELLIPSGSAWAAAQDSGLLALAPRAMVDNYWKVYFIQDATVRQIRSVYAELDTLQALASIHVNASSLSAADRQTILLAYANYRQKLKILKLDLGLLSTAAGLVLHDRTVDAKSLYSK